MCGIAGVFIKNEEIDTSKIVHEMCQSLVHRGPDDQGIYTYENFSMGMRRLSIIDIDGGHQPICSEDGRYVIVYNGELYNFAQLKKDLIAQGSRFRTNSDTEVVLNAYIKYGKECLQLFNGMYAFAIFDKVKKEFFLARDRMGIKPLFYSSLSGRGFTFASELKALLKVPGVDRTIDSVAMNQYFVFEYIPEPRSIYKDIKKLPAASCLEFTRNDNIKIHPYWEINLSLPEENDQERAKDEIKTLLRSSVKYRLVSDVPVGLFLSGGIDSSAIATEFKECLSNDEAISFSVGFDNKSYDESVYAKMMSEHVGLNHKHKCLDEKEVLDLIPEIICQLDEPLADASIIPTYFLSNFTRQSVKVALSGDGGDELFLGYNTHYAHKLARWFKFLPKGFYNHFLNFLSVLPVSDNNVSFEFKLKKFFSGLGFPSDIANVLWWGAYSPETLTNLMRSKSVGFDEIFEPVMHHRKKLKGLDTLKQISFLDTQLYLKDNLLPKVDRSSMANSLEVRTPFSDHRLVEYAMKIPSRWKLKGSVGKHILRSAYQDKLPATILKRPKKGFDIPLTPWLRGQLKSLIDQYLSKDKCEASGQFSYPFVQSLVSEHFLRRRNHRQLLWTIIVFQMWYFKYGPSISK